ncbi:MAG: serine--tRNA ligase, partial [Candidatus Omnitrophota bacterium]
MLDPKFIRENVDIVRKSLKDRGVKLDLDGFLELDKRRRELIQKDEDLKRQKNEASKKIGELIKQKADVSSAKAEVTDISEKIHALDKELKQVEEKYYSFLDVVPNIPHESVPVGRSPKDNKIIKESGKIPKFSFTPRDHVELGEINSLFDFERGAKVAGSFFPLYVGAGAKLERALLNFMLDVHIKEHGYKEVFPPFLVNRQSMRGTGQLPKLEEDMYKISE